MDGLRAAKAQHPEAFVVPSQSSSPGWFGDLKVVDRDNVQALDQALSDVLQAFGVGGRPARAEADGSGPTRDATSPAAFVPACPLENLGDLSFCADHQLRYPYVAGSMANGIGSVEVVEAMGRN